MCGGGPSRRLRHNLIRDMIAKAAREVGFKTDIEHGSGLQDGRKPGDVIIYNWKKSKHLLIDVAVVNPLGSSRIDLLTKDGVGSAARAHEETKRRTYRDIDFDKYEFLPFIMETTA